MTDQSEGRSGKQSGESGPLYPEHGTCDRCATGGVSLRWIYADDSGCAWICQACDAFHDAAIKAACEAIRQDWPEAAAMSDGLVRSIAEAAVKSYCEFTNDPDDFASREATDG